ncbi:hypothetical protein B484DRAFT_445511 [Ochromonadaceae sp. CCMP2298]|nr:hypothetical protein B484DRAFT_445511 [Ochromonadaceae sp. CCMP2298]
MRGLFGSMRRLQTEGISLTKLTFNDCHFGDEVVDVGNDALSELTIDQCCSGRYHTPGISTFGCTHLVWDIVQKCPNLERFTCIDQQTFATMETGEGEYDEVAEDAILTGSEVTMSDADLCALAKFCPDLETLYINSYDTRITEKSIIYLAMRGTQLRELGLYLKRDKALTDAAIIAIANMAHLKVLEVGTLELKNPLTLRCIAHQCPHLKSLSLHTSNVTEAELVYFAQHGQLDRLAVGKQQLNFPGKSIRTDHHSYRPGYLPVLDAGDIEALEAAQRTWLLTAEQHWLHLPAGENTEEKLKAADPHLTVLWMSASRSEYHLSVDLGDARVPRLFTNISSEWSDYTAHLVSFP